MIRLYFTTIWVSNCGHWTHVSSHSIIVAVFPAEVKVERDELKVSHRDITGKKVKLLRKEGITPVNMYGPNIESVSLQVETALLKRLLAKVGKNALISLKLDGGKKPKMVMVRDIQRDPLTGALLHVDFFQVEMTHKIRADVPLLFRATIQRL